MFTATTAVITPGQNGAASPHPVYQRTYKLSFVVLVGVISFLIGSLLRSLLSPGDYIFFTKNVDNVELALMELLEPNRKWKYAVRLLQIPIPGLSRDLVAAVVERD